MRFFFQHQRIPNGSRSIEVNSWPFVKKCWKLYRDQLCHGFHTSTVALNYAVKMGAATKINACEMTTWNDHDLRTAILNDTAAKTNRCLIWYLSNSPLLFFLVCLAHGSDFGKTRLPSLRSTLQATVKKVAWLFGCTKLYQIFGMSRFSEFRHSLLPTCSTGVHGFAAQFPKCKRAAIGCRLRDLRVPSGCWKKSSFLDTFLEGIHHHRTGNFWICYFQASETATCK